jgi:two-component system CheB/CheR fusion protein
MAEEPAPPLNAPSAPPEAAQPPAPTEAVGPDERLDEVIPRRHRPAQPVIGLGGSAGSLSALRAFFAAMPADSGWAFVVVVHLLPDRESNLAALLQGFTPYALT